jgi:hypothetical protein
MAREGDEYASSALATPKPREVEFQQTALEESSQHPLDQRTQRPKLPNEPS